MCLHAAHRVNPIFSISFSRRNPRSGISNMHASRQSILYGPLTDVTPVTEFGPAQCLMLFVTAVRALNVPLSLGGNRTRRERVRAQVKQFFWPPHRRRTGWKSKHMLHIWVPLLDPTVGFPPPPMTALGGDIQYAWRYDNAMTFRIQ